MAFKIIDIALENTQCSLNNIMFFKTTDRLMLDIGGVYSRCEVYPAASTYGTAQLHWIKTVWKNFNSQSSQNWKYLFCVQPQIVD